MPDDFDANESFQVTAYNPQWPAQFEAERDRVAAIMGENAIEIKHVGSTSVPGLSAKPIIDLLLVVESFAPVEEYKRLLEPLGYHDHPHEDQDERMFFWKGRPRSHHLHIVEYATWEHQRHVIFRDYLRRHPEVAQEYEKVKRELAVAFKTNRPAYTRGKTAFINNIMARAVEEILDPSLRRLVEAAKQDTDDATGPGPDGHTGTGGSGGDSNPAPSTSSATDPALSSGSDTMPT